MLKLLKSLWGQPASPVQAKVELYTWQTCPFCIRAKLLLWWKGVQYQEYKIDGDEHARAQMANRAQGRRTVPQIFINQQHIGGCDDLNRLSREGALDGLLAKAP